MFSCPSGLRRIFDDDESYVSHEKVDAAMDELVIISPFIASVKFLSRRDFLK